MRRMRGTCRTLNGKATCKSSAKYATETSLLHKSSTIREARACSTLIPTNDIQINSHNVKPHRNSKWSNNEHRKQFFDRLSESLGIQTQMDWYSVRNDDIVDMKGSRILFHFNDSLFQALQSVYPQYEWLPWNFIHATRSFWSKLENQRTFFDWLRGELGIQSMEDWYDIKLSDIRQKGVRIFVFDFNEITPSLKSGDVFCCVVSVVVLLLSSKCTAC
jgi:hypothetical protein